VKDEIGAIKREFLVDEHNHKVKFRLGGKMELCTDKAPPDNVRSCIA
jgi:hypothetical protein